MLPVLVMVAAFSRFIAAVMLPSRTRPWTWWPGCGSCWRSSFAAVPRRWSGTTKPGSAAAAGLTDRRGWCSPGTLATRIVQLKPYDPESKGMVERANRYLETSFLPGGSFASPADFNTQLASWLPIANSRPVRVLGRPSRSTS